MHPRVIWLMRHAEARKAAGQSEDDLFSIDDQGLSARGIRQAEAARDALASERFDAVYASTYRRSQETARIVAAPHGLDVHVEPRLAEIPVGGADYHEVLANILDLPHRIEEHRPRIDAFAAAMEEVAGRHERALVVAHGLANRAFLSRVRGSPLSEMLAIEQDHAHATRLARGPDGRWSAQSRAA